MLLEFSLAHGLAREVFSWRGSRAHSLRAQAAVPELASSPWAEQTQGVNPFVARECARSDSSGAWTPGLPNVDIEGELPAPATLLLSLQNGETGGAPLPPADNASQQTPLAGPPTPDEMTKPNSTESERWDCIAPIGLLRADKRCHLAEPLSPCRGGARRHLLQWCPLRGVPREHHFEFCCNPDGVGRYTPACRGKFICGDGATISLSRANDGYCDCRDGSDEPGTSACARPHNRFSCVKLEAPPPVAPRVRRAKGDPASRLRAGRLRDQNQNHPSDTAKFSRWPGK
ncbi:hypothetical protein CYMTET_11964 [Cymbomonas tetramitiformis]|uniref:Glucosidase II beta subunit N-terminal domain-containing protein n=1 Tax=Cymbomonas tetramitiformis TaxID=36881 RepID=A0AAE0GLI6_9CHLO|nr:hypothetical protein CYMTET_11964 [Cymbomonas tetramitiformis]